MHKERYVIGRGSHLLVEFSDYGIPPSLPNLLAQLMARRMVPVITHSGRNPLFLKDPKRALDFAGQACLIQVTANSLTGFWGNRCREMAKWLLARNAVHVVHSDAHDPVRRRPVLSQAHAVVEKLAGAAVAAELFETNPAAIIQTDSIRPTAMPDPSAPSLN